MTESFWEPFPSYVLIYFLPLSLDWNKRGHKCRLVFCACPCLYYAISDILKTSMLTCVIMMNWSLFPPSKIAKVGTHRKSKCLIPQANISWHMDILTWYFEMEPLISRIYLFEESIETCCHVEMCDIAIEESAFHLVAPLESDRPHAAYKLDKFKCHKSPH